MWRRVMNRLFGFSSFRSEKKMTQNYSKDSFDRFGDDLCDLLLSYLPFEEKISFECVAKQWKRYVFSRQRDLFIGYTKTFSSFGGTQEVVDLKALETILKKCRYIGSVYVKEDIDNKEEVFELIVKYCHNLTQIKSDFDGLTQKTIKAFFDKFGPNLKKIRFHLNKESNKEVLKLCPNLSVLNIHVFSNMSAIFDSNELLFKKLTDISFNYSSDDLNRVEVLVENNKNSLESVRVNVKTIYVTKCQINVLLKLLSKLTNLKKFVITSDSLIDNSFVSYLREFGTKCQKLKKIELILKTNSNALKSEIIQTINHCFKELKRLKFSSINWFAIINSQNQLELTSEALNECQNLTHLSFFSNDVLITDQFFTNIDKHLPKLQSIDCQNTEVSDKTLHSLSKLSNIQSIDLQSNSSEQPITESVVLDLIRNCPKVMKINFGNKGIRIQLNDREISELRLSDGQNCGFDIINYINFGSDGESNGFSSEVESD